MVIFSHRKNKKLDGVTWNINLDIIRVACSLIYSVNDFAENNIQYARMYIHFIAKTITLKLQYLFFY